MECYKCGALLGPEDQCPNCGTDVKMYKKIVAVSNYYYNRGLERARVRDLTGAVEALRVSLQYNKINIDARNLLGLVYYETGETVSALSEWVISKNCQDKENAAERYLADVQSNQALLNTINQTIKKYNQALTYCRQDSTDLAIIQLKKVISLNPKLVKAHQLLALVYIKDGKYEQARKYLRTAEQIDRNNTITMRYLAEIREQIGEKTKQKKRKKKENTVAYSSGNDTIIQPANLRDNTGVMMIVNILVGLLIGVTATWFLIVPNIRQGLQKDTNAAVSEANDTIASKNQQIQILQDQVDSLTEDVASAQSANADTQETIDTYAKLMAAYQAYRNGELENAGDALASVDESLLDATSKQIYEAMRTEVDAKYLETTYDEGYGAYTRYEYETSADLLQKVVDMDKTYHNGEAAYYLAQSYRNIDKLREAAVLYQFVIDNYPSSYQAYNAKDYLEDIQNELGIAPESE